MRQAISDSECTRIFNAALNAKLRSGELLRWMRGIDQSIPR